MAAATISVCFSHESLYWSPPSGTPTVGAILLSVSYRVRSPLDFVSRMRSGRSAAIFSYSGSRVPISCGLLSYLPSAHGPTPSPPNASQSLAPTG